MGDQILVLSNQICEFVTYGQLQINYWSSYIRIGYYELDGAGLGASCAVSPTEVLYTSETVLLTKGTSTSNGTCGYLVYIENSNTAGFNFTVDIYRNSASGITYSLVAALSSIAIMFS